MTGASTNAPASAAAVAATPGATGVDGPAGGSAAPKPITVAVLAMGGDGGGVLADWIERLAMSQGFATQATSVAGVAQRTGATVYYIEMIAPASDPDETRQPVLSTFPTPGQVDVVIASELMEAGRAVQRGLCTPDRTTLIASTNRVYTIAERMAMGDGRVDSDTLAEGAHQAARFFIGADFHELAVEAGSVISSSLFGAVAAAQVLPFPRAEFEATIRESGRGVERSLAAFALGYDRAEQIATEQIERAASGRFDEGGDGGGSQANAAVSVSITTRPERRAKRDADKRDRQRRAELAANEPERLVGPALRDEALRVGTDFPVAARSMLLYGCERTAVYQDSDYTTRYLDRVARLAEVDPDADGDAALTVAAARHVALWMCYQDTVHVGLQKIRTGRLDRVRAEAKAGPEQLMHVHEYLHPQLDEIVDSLPTRLGQRLAKSKMFARLVGRFTRDGIVLNTTSAYGYTLLWLMARARPLRPRSLRFGREQAAIEDWIDLAARAAGELGPATAREIIGCEQVLKGYGATHAHGAESFDLLMRAATDLMAAGDEAADGNRPSASAVAGGDTRAGGYDDARVGAALASLRTAALADEDGSALRRELASRGLRVH